MNFTDLYQFADNLKQQLLGEKPGFMAHEMMIPKGRLLFPEKGNPPRQSAVLLLFYKKNGIIYFPLIRRPVYDGMHSGQMALPGGKQEPADTSLIQTALRESAEEIGINPEQLFVLGTLSEIYIQVTHMMVLPVVAFVNEPPVFKTDPHEVDMLFEIPLIDVLKPETKKTEIWNLRGTATEVPFYLLNHQKVWGATAMILSELKELLHSLEIEN